MTYTSMLAVASGQASDDAMLEAAVRLASRFGAGVRAVPTYPDPAVSVMGLGFTLPAPVSPSVLEMIMQGERDTIARVTDAARTAARKAGVPFGANGCGARVEVSLRDHFPWLAVADALPLADLAVFGAEGARGVGPAAPTFAAVLFLARVPVLVVPPEGTSEFRRVCVAWDGGLEAGRAVRAATPLLLAADEVVVLQALHGLSAQQRESPTSRPENLIAHLKCLGVQRASIRTIEDDPEGPGLLAAAKAAEGNLLVAGAYGHSRFREFVLGGATRSFVSAPEGFPLFLAH